MTGGRRRKRLKVEWGNVLGLVGLLATLIIFWHQEAKPRLVIYPQSSFQLNLTEQATKKQQETTPALPLIVLPENMKVLIEGKEYASMEFTLWRIANEGDKVIRTSDFSTPLTATMEDGAKIISFQKIDVVEGLSANWERSEDQTGVTLKPVLLNPGDATYLCVAVSHPPERGNAVTAKWTARIAGVSALESYQNADDLPISPVHVLIIFADWQIAILCMGGVSLFLIVVSAFKRTKPRMLQKPLYPAGLALLSFACAEVLATMYTRGLRNVNWLYSAPVAGLYIVVTWIGIFGGVLPRRRAPVPAKLNSPSS